MSSYDPLELPPALERRATQIIEPTKDTPSFYIDATRKSYKHQYSNIYFIRLLKLRGVVERNAKKKWENVPGNPKLIPRVLEVEKGKLCYIVGTVYMDMPLKPNVMEDIARDQQVPPLPPRKKIYSKEDQTMLEDESGRICLVGEKVRGARLVTGVIMAVLGMETIEGDFQIVDYCFAEMPPQARIEGGVDEGKTDAEDTMDVDVDDAEDSDEWIGLISGLDVGSLSPSDAQIQMLTEYLTGEGGAVYDQVSASQISRLIIAGDSLAPITPSIGQPLTPKARKLKKKGIDPTGNGFSPHPIFTLNATLYDIASVMPIHILPGENDPSGVILPQQPFPRAMFGESARYSTFICETNPTYIALSSDPSSKKPVVRRTLLVNSGQPLNDMLKYLPTPPYTRLSIVESTLRWRHLAPTCPDTLWCHPYRDEDPFLIRETPDIYIVGGQKKFATKLVEESEVRVKGKIPSRCRVILVPKFAETGILVLLNLRTLAVKKIHFAVHGMRSGGEADAKDEMVGDPEPEAAAARPAQMEPSQSLDNEPKSSMDYGFL